MEKIWTIEDVADGSVILEKDGSVEDLAKILKLAFPQDDTDVTIGGWVNDKYFRKLYGDDTEFVDMSEEEFQEDPRPVVKVSELLAQFAEVVEPKVRVFDSGSKRDDDSNKPLVNHLDPYLRLRFGYLLRQGANKYEKGNWRKLQPTETALESLHRHLAKFELNLNNGVAQDEDHLAAVIFNVMLIMKNEEKGGIAADQFYGTLK